MQDIDMVDLTCKASLDPEDGGAVAVLSDVKSTGGAAAVPSDVRSTGGAVAVPSEVYWRCCSCS